MRKFILVAAMVLVSATAQAGGKRSLTLVSTDQPATAAQPQAAQTPKSVERPRLSVWQHIGRRPHRPYPASAQGTPAMKAGMTRRHRPSVIGRIVYALHRHGIYW